MTGVILLGPPGVGKGTQARKIAERFGVPAISTGNIFRSNIQADTELGRIAKAYLDQGSFVPDSVTTPMVAARLSAPDVTSVGFLLDGYPRTLEQAYALRDILIGYHLGIDAVIALEADHDTLVERMQKRAVEEDRSDDRPEVFRHRLEEYEHRSEPIFSYYSDLDLLDTIDGNGSVEEVTAKIATALSARGL